MLVTVESLLESGLLQHVLSVGEVGEVSEREVVASEVLGLGKLSLEDVEETVELLSEGSNLRLVGGGTSEGGAEEELPDDIGDGTRVGLVGREPLLDLTALLQVSRVELGSLVLVGDVADDCARLEDAVVTVKERRNLSEGLHLLKELWRLVNASRQVYDDELIRGTNFLKGSDDAAGAGGAGVTVELVGHFCLLICSAWVLCVAIKQGLEESELVLERVVLGRSEPETDQNAHEREGLPLARGLPESSSLFWKVSELSGRIFVFLRASSRFSTKPTCSSTRSEHRETPSAIQWGALVALGPKRFFFGFCWLLPAFFRGAQRQKPFQKILLGYLNEVCTCREALETR